MKRRKFLSILLTTALSFNVVASVSASDTDISSGDAVQNENVMTEVPNVKLPLVENEDLNMDDVSEDAITDGIEAEDEDKSDFSDTPEVESDIFTDSAAADSEFSGEGSTGNMVVGGYIPGNLDYNTPVYDESPYVRSVVPAAYPVSSEDLEQARAWMNDRYPAVRDQNPYGTCWSFATMGLAEFDLINKGIFTKANDLSELQLAHFTYNFVEDPLGGTVGDIAIYNSNDIKDSYLDRGGNYEYAVRRLNQWVGAVNETDVPYSNAENAVTKGLADSYAYDKDVAHLENAYMINIKQNPQAVKEQIMECGAVGIMYTHLYAGANFIYNTYYDTPNTTPFGGGHAAMIVGWNDNYPKERFGSSTGAAKPSADGAWLIRNSWGSGSGNLDYFWMSYETYTLGTTAWAMDFTTADNYDNNYQLDGGVITYKCNNATTVANVFTVGEKADVKSETLKAVSLSFTHEADVNYTIDIYTDIQQKDYSSSKIWYPPTNGVKQEAASTSGITSYAGVYTIPLEHEVELQPGTVFSVVVTMDKSAMDCEEGYVEGKWTHTVSEYDGYEYRSTYLKSGTNKFIPNNRDFCIKAFTSNNKGTSISDTLYGYSLNLDGAIAINMYMDLPEAVVANQDAYMEFVLPNGKTSDVKVVDARQKDGHYIFTCRVAAKEMAQDVKAKMVVNGQSGQEYTFGVQKYVQYILQHSDQYQSVISLVKSMLNYGAAAQVHFNYNVDKLANSIPEMNENDKTVNKVEFQADDKSYFDEGEVSGIHWYGSSLVLEADTCYKYYFYLDSDNSIDDYSFSCNSVSLNPVEKEINGKTYYYVEVSDIKAQNLADKVEVVVSKNGQAKKAMIIRYSAFSYAYDLQQSEQQNDNLKQVTYAMYQYWQLAKRYVNNKTA